MIILFGGSFDPIHLGHIDFAHRLLKKFHPKRLLLVPTRQNPLRADSPKASAEDRLHMARLATEGVSGIEVVDWETHRPLPSYTLQTVEKANATFPDEKIAVAIGNEVFQNFERWHEPQKLLSLADWIICTRSGKINTTQIEIILKNCGAKNITLKEKTFSYTALESNHTLEIFEFEPLPISSTQIREAFSQDSPIPECLNFHVTLYIKQRQLYSVKN